MLAATEDRRQKDLGEKNQKKVFIRESESEDNTENTNKTRRISSCFNSHPISPQKTSTRDCRRWQQRRWIFLSSYTFHLRFSSVLICEIFLNLLCCCCIHFNLILRLVGWIFWINKHRRRWKIACKKKGEINWNLFRSFVRMNNKRMNFDSSR